jgi:hypothetical protein
MKIYRNSFDNSCRYVLGEVGKSNIICFGINPSTADDVHYDSTINHVIGTSKRLGFDGWIMLNVYPQRATNPNDLDTVFDQIKHKNNLDHIKEMFSGNINYIWAAWGNLIMKRNYLLSALSDIYLESIKANMNWLYVGPLTKNGNPHHPLYLPATSDKSEFDIKKYLSK